MNLAFVATRYDTMGGTERDLYELTLRLAARGHTPHVYCLEARIPAADGVRVRVLGKGSGVRTARAWRLARRGPEAAYAGGHDLVISYAKVLRQDIVRCGGGAHRVFLDRMAPEQGAAARWFRTLDPYHRSICRIEQRQYLPGHYRRVQAVSKVVKRELTDSLGVPADDIDVVYDGIDTDRFHPEQAARDRVSARRQLNLSADDPVVLFVGNAFRRKGLRTLLRGVAESAHQDLHCVVVGQDPEANRFQSLARDLGLAERVQFVGGQADVAPYYAAADLLVLPSLHEAFGNTVLEAMACGRPAIVSPRAGAAEIMAGRLSDLVMHEAGDHEELATKLDEVLGSARLAGFGDTARRTAEEYSLEAHVNHVEDHYRSVLEGMGQEKMPSD